jgi:hypothetical protein
MEIKVSTEKGRVPVTVMHVDGNIDANTFEIFQTKADELIQGGTRYLLVDLTHVPFLSSSGLRALHAIFIELRALFPDISDEEMRKGISAGTYKSPNLKLLNPSKETKVAIETGGFDMYLEIHHDRKTAIASF